MSRLRVATTLTIVLGALSMAAGAAHADPQLPDGRVYEKVSPADKGNADAGPVIGPGLNEAGLHQAAATSDAILYGVYGSFAGNASLGGSYSHYLARRDPLRGWLTEGVDPPLNGGTGGGESRGYLAFSNELEIGIINGGRSTPLAPGANPDHDTAYLRDNRTGGYSVLTPNRLGNDNPSAGSATFEHIAYEEGGWPAEVPGAPARSVYEYVGGERRVASVLPGGSYAPEGTVLGSGNMPGGWGRANTVSADGERILFTTPIPSFVGDADGEIYVREADATPPVTHHVSRAMPDAPADELRMKLYLGATPSMDHVFFASKQPLTADATTSSTGNGLDLYRHTISTGETIDISRDVVDPDGAVVQGMVGFSNDGSRAYFVAHGTIVPGEGVAGEPNLYLWEDDGTRFADDGEPNGRIQFVATLTPADVEVWGEDNDVGNLSPRRARVSPDGRILAFESAANPALDGSGFDTGGGRQLYVYDAEAETVVCVSCRGNSGASTESFLRPTVAGNVPLLSQRLPRNLSADGSRLFFTSTARLVADDVNDQRDAYQYDVDDGRLHLLSTGDSTSPSTFWDADVSGQDVFFTTRTRLVPEDVDTLVDLYAARVGGRSFTPAPQPPQCPAEDCQRPANPLGRDLRPLGSAIVHGPGEVARPPDGLRIAGISSDQRRRFARTGRMVLRVQVPRAGVLRVSFDRGADRTVRVRRAGTARVTLSLSRKARRALARRRTLRVRLAVRLGSSRRTTTLTLRRTK